MSAPELDFDYIKACIKICALEEQLLAFADEDRAARGPGGEVIRPTRGAQGEEIWWA